jgi:hypothetical protein
MWGALEEIGDRDDEARRAEAALDGAGVDERLLHRMQVLVPREPLDRHDLVALRLGAEHETGADERAVEQHRARAALALLARVLRAGELERVSEHHEEALAAPEVGLERLAVHRQRDPHDLRHLVSARPASTPSAWRR